MKEQEGGRESLGLSTTPILIGTWPENLAVIKAGNLQIGRGET